MSKKGIRSLEESLLWKPKRTVPAREVKELPKVQVLSETKEFDIINVPLGLIEMNPDNPNVMDGADMEVLKHSLKKYGYIEFIVTVKNPETGKYLVVDGAHRVLALKEGGKTDKDMLTAILAKTVSFADAWLGSYTFNKAKGRIKSDLVAKFLMRSEVQFGLPKTLEMTGLTREYFDEYTSALKASIKVRERMESGDNIFGELEKGGTDGEVTVKPEFRAVPITHEKTVSTIVSRDLKPIASVETGEMKVLFVVELSQKDNSFISGVLKKYSMDPAVALIEVCKKVEGIE